jgi:hypothetical protein
LLTVETPKDAVPLGTVAGSQLLPLLKLLSSGVWRQSASTARAEEIVRVSEAIRATAATKGNRLRRDALTKHMRAKCILEAPQLAV